MDPVNFAYAVLKAIRQRIELTEQAILAGSPKTLEDYRQLTGELKGLQFAEQEIKDALDKTEKEES
jgi:predicted  nucleic acid-binding Zn-ribbon protein|tara:strand:+ start:289 stop:486 length:198 start_codon:yes stop_codon:yes gene_type:complete